MINYLFLNYLFQLFTRIDHFWSVSVCTLFCRKVHFTRNLIKKTFNILCIYDTKSEIFKPFVFLILIVIASTVK